MPADWTIVEKTIALAILDLGIVVLLVRAISPLQFRALKWSFVFSAALFWGLFVVALLWSLWDSYYSYFYTEGSRWFAWSAVLLYALIGLALWWLAVRLPGDPVFNLLVLGGLESVPEHLLGIYRFNILERVPGLQGFSAESIFVFAFFEYLLYWSIVLGFASFIHALTERRLHRRARMI